MCLSACVTLDIDVYTEHQYEILQMHHTTKVLFANPDN